MAASTGNHGAAVAYAMAKLRIPGTVFVPEGASSTKLNAIRAWEPRSTCMARMGWNPKPRRGATPSRGLVYLSPYNDPYVVAGQGTIGAELARQLDRIDVLCISVGGGGLVGGASPGTSRTGPRRCGGGLLAREVQGDVRIGESGANPRSALGAYPVRWDGRWSRGRCDHVPTLPGAHR